MCAGESPRGTACATPTRSYGDRREMGRALVLHDARRDVVADLFAQLLLPRSHRVERRAVCGGEDDDRGAGAAVVRPRDGVEFFLARGVPDHQSHVLAHGFDVRDLLEEVHADGLLVVLREDAAAVPSDHGRLPDAAVPDDDDLDLLLEVLLELRGRRDDAAGRRSAKR
eukprot:31431-Pelagococcus_subviridis.AAC.12